MEKLGRLEAIAARDIWRHEALDFTPWLLDNADSLAEVLGIDIELNSVEHPVGGFALDLIGRDLTNNCVLIVENQLATTDHGHLGQLITYAAGTDAETVVWLATDFREEHRQALDFLNDLGGESVRFFGVEIGAVRIGDSVPAPHFKLRAQPNDWHAQVASDAKSTSREAGKAPLYRAFWTRFLERVHNEHPAWTNARKPQPVNWLPMPSPFKGEGYYAFAFSAGSKLKSELYLDFQDPDAVDELFGNLLSLRDQIEQTYGGALYWEELPTKRASRIADYTDGDVANEEQFDAYIDWLFDAGTRLRLAIDTVLPQVSGQ